MTIQALNIALSGLNVAKQALEVTSNNIANAGVEGYTRKILPQFTSVSRLNNNFFGVNAGVIRREMDVALRRDFWGQVTTESYLDTRTRFLQRIQEFHGPSEAESSFASAVSDLKAGFAELASSPNDVFVQSNVLNQARKTATEINQFADLITNTRNDAQNEITDVVTQINELLSSIADQNVSIRRATSLGQSTAQLEDTRDLLVKDLSVLIDTTQFTRADGVLVIQTRGGTILADESAQQLSFSPTLLTPTSTGNSIFLNDTSGLDFSTITVGGSLGALLELRDETLPTYQAQIDELAHKLALRFESQGLRLYTDETGNIPGLAVTDYLGFSSRIQVNTAIESNPSLLRDGTEASIIVGQGSSDVIQKVLDFVFGPNQTLQATGSVDISGPVDLFTLLGVSAEATAAGTSNISALGALDSQPDINPGDQFTLQVGASPPVTITINPGDTATDLIANINAALNPNLSASFGSSNQLVLNAAEDITIANTTLSLAGLSTLGFAPGTTAAVNPSFTLELSTGPIQTIEVAAGETGADLLANINAITGVDATLDGSGFLQITPSFGGDLLLTDINGGLLSALGINFTEVPHVPVETTGLGASGTIETGIATADFIEEYARRSITSQVNDFNGVVRDLEIESDFRQVLETSLVNQFGVDIDQEVAALIQIQTNYAAAARVIQAADELFDELLNAFR